MNERQCEIVLALAECDMTVTEVAKKLFMHRNTVVYHIERIHAKTGKNPLKFYDLADLVSWITHWMPMPEALNDLKILDQKKEA